MNKTKPSVEPIAIGRIGAKPFVSPRRNRPVHNLQHDKIHALALDIFRKYDYEPMDMEALIFCILQGFDISIHSYEGMYKKVRTYILENFSITQGKHLLLQEINMRRMVVGCSHTE